METDIANYLAENVNEFICRNTLHGNKDVGDIANVRTRHNERVVIEVKNVLKQSLPQWISEAKQEAKNDGALCGLVISKRHGKSDPGDQWVHCTVRELVALLTGKEPE